MNKTAQLITIMENLSTARAHVQDAILEMDSLGDRQGIAAAKHIYALVGTLIDDIDERSK